MVFREGAAEEVLPSDGLGAMADVERRLRGRDAVGSLMLRFGDNAAGFGAVVEEWVLSNGDVVFPFLYTGADLDGFGDVVVESF